MIKAAIISILLSVTLTPVSQMLHIKMVVDTGFAEERGMKGIKKGGEVHVTGVNYLRYYYNPVHYFELNWKIIGLNAFIAFIASLLTLKLAGRNGAT